MEHRRAGEDAVDHRQLRHGWCVGSDEFRKELLAAAVQRVGPSYYGKSRQESNEEKAERIIAGEPAYLDWPGKKLLEQPKGDNRKVNIARRLRQETTMTLQWIAQCLEMGGWGYVSNLLNPKRNPKGINFED